MDQFTIMSGFIAFMSALVALYVHFFDKDSHEKNRQDTTYKKIKESQREEKRLTRLTTKKKVEIVMDIFQGKITIDEASRMYDITPSVIGTWIKEAQQGMENQLNASAKDLLTQYEEKIKEMKMIIGELTLQKSALERDC